MSPLAIAVVGFTVSTGMVVTFPFVALWMWRRGKLAELLALEVAGTAVSVVGIVVAEHLR